MKNMRENQYWQFFMKYFKKKLLLILLLTLLIIVGVAAGNLNPLLYGSILDAITSGDLRMVTRFIVIYFFVNIAVVLLSLFESSIGRLVSFYIGSDVRQGLFSKIIRMRFKNLDKYSAGELISRLDSDADSVVAFYISVITNTVLIAFNLVVSVYFVAAISARLSLVSVIYIPASAAVTIAFRKKLRTLEKRQRKYYDEYMKFINETFNNIYGLRSYQLENVSEAAFSGFIGKQLTLIKKAIHLNNIMSGIGRIISNTFYLVTLYLSARFIIEGTLTIGNMVAFNIYAGKLYDTVSNILTMNKTAQGVIVSMNRIDNLHKESDETPLYEGALSLPGLITHVNADQIKFTYANVNILNGLTLQCGSPGLYSIVGKNGSGKSTLLKIIMGFYDSEGSIIFSMDNTHEKNTAADIGLINLRKKITYISKDSYFTNDTVINNLKLSNQLLTDEYIINICEELGYSTFIESLPEKYGTVLSVNGVPLSSGQKQLLSVLRAYIADTEIVLLDEITSDMDGTVELEVIKLLKEMAKTRILLLVSHKIGPVTDSKNIFLIDNGRVVDQGTHFSLMERSALYRKLFLQER